MKCFNCLDNDAMPGYECCGGCEQNLRQQEEAREQEKHREEFDLENEMERQKELEVTDGE